MPTPTVGAEMLELSRAILAISAESELDDVLQMFVDHARVLIDARYAALGVPDATGLTLARFHVSGMTPEQIEAIGPFPVGRGLLGHVLRQGQTLRVARIQDHPLSIGFPPGHPPMTSFLGVPIRGRDEVLGDLYLTDKIGALEFSDDDERLAELLAQHAALAIVNTRLVSDLAASEQRYRLLTQGAPEIVFALNEAGRITFVNDRVRQVSGHEPRAFMDKSLRDLALSEDRPIVDVHLRAMRNGAPRADFPMRSRGSDGSTRYFEVSLVPGAGSTGFQGIAQDVTDRHQLAREIADRTRELSSTRAERERLREFVSLVIQAQEDERARIAGDLHDTTVQTLTAIGRRLNSLAAAVPVDSVDLQDELATLGEAAMAEAEEVRRLSRNLRPSVLDHLGLAAALQNLASELDGDGVEARLVVRGDAARLANSAVTALFRIAQESLTNARRHSRATVVEIALEVGERDVSLTVMDNGVGFSEPSPGSRRVGRSAGLGLAGMRERAGILGGALDIDSAPDGGTRVTARLPLETEDP